MTIKIAKRINDIYVSANKNVEYTLDFLLSSIEVDCCKKAIDAIEEFTIIGEKTSIDISDKIVGMVNKVLGCSDEKTIEKLLWIAVMFPEI